MVIISPKEISAIHFFQNNIILRNKDKIEETVRTLMMFTHHIEP